MLMTLDVPLHIRGEAGVQRGHHPVGCMASSGFFFPEGHPQSQGSGVRGDAASLP